MHAHYAQREAPVLTRRRHADALAEALDALQRAETIADTGLELAAEDLRLASRALGRITGAVDVEALLDIVFADFCIGK
jgi:tRNA modification GTPase